MCCRGCGPSEYALEYTRRFKPENNGGCGAKNGGCDEPTRAIEGSPRWEWEQIYGKLVTYVFWESDSQGRLRQVIERIPCPPTAKDPYAPTCCSVRYRVIR